MSPSIRNRRRPIQRKALRVIFEALEERTLFSAAFPSAAEQYMLYLINQERANPPAAIQALANDPDWAGATPDLNEGLPAGTITTDPKAPLAFNPYLVSASELHSQWMLANNLFQHNEGNAQPNDRDTAAGYVFGPNGSSGENISETGYNGTLDIVAQAQANENQLVVDSGTDGRGHRLAIFNPGYNEIGLGITNGGPFQGSSQAVIVTQDFANAGNGSFLTGVAYNDVNQTGKFAYNEGLGNVTVTATRTSDNMVFTTTSWAAGGYSLQLPAGTYQVTASGGTIGSPAPQTITIGTQNVEADFSATVTQPTTPTAPAISTQPASQNVALGNSATFAVQATGNPLPTVQWQVSTDGGTTFTNIAGANGQTYTFTPTADQTGNLYQAVLTNTQGTVTSSPATLSISGLPLNITVQPNFTSANAGDTVTFTAAATGSGVMTQWQVSTDGGNTFTDIPGATTGTLTFTATPDLNGNVYQVVFTDNSGASAFAEAPLVVNAAPAAPVITAQPTAAAATDGTATLNVVATGYPQDSVQWQMATGKTPVFTDVPGATSDTLSMTVTLSDNNARYRAVVTNPEGSITSKTAKLSVNMKSPVANDLTDLKNTANEALAAITVCKDTTEATVSALTSDLKRLHANASQKALLKTLVVNERASRNNLQRNETRVLKVVQRDAATVSADSISLAKHAGNSALEAKLTAAVAALQAAAATSTVPADASHCQFATADAVAPLASVDPTDVKLQNDIDAAHTNAFNIGQTLQAPMTVVQQIVTLVTSDATA